MGLFSRILGETLSEEEQVRQAQVLIQEVQEMSARSPQKGLKILRKRAKPLYEVLGIGGQVHKAFRELVQTLWSRNTVRPNPNLSTVEPLPWSTWQNPTLQDLQAKARGMVCDILYCKAPKSRSCKNALAELEALRYFANDAKIVMAIIYEEDMLFRKSFVMEAAEVLDPNLEEIGQGFIDYARQTGKKTIDL